MASVYERKESPFYWAKIRDAKTLKWKAIATPYRKLDPAGKRRALMWAAEKDNVGAENRSLVKSEAWMYWVPDWLRTTYAYNRNTQTRYMNAWEPLFEFLSEHQVVVPRQLEYHHAQDYIAWRIQQTRHCGKLINHNTAVTELKILSRIVREAHQRKYTDSNPFYQLGLRRINVKEKPELTEEECEIIRARLKEKEGALPIGDRWMTTSFEIAIHQGCRLRETSLPMENVDTVGRTITFIAKGRMGKAKIFSTALHPGLIPLMRDLEKAGAAVTCTLPKMASKEWWKFRRDHDLAHTAFHSTRVTVITQMARNKVTQQMAMRFVGHASETVHRIYTRLNVADVAGVTDAITFSKPGKPGTPGVG